MKLKKIVLISLIIGLSLILSGCSVTSSKSVEEEKTSGTYLVTQSEREIGKLVNYFKSTYSELYDKTQTATNEDAETIKQEIKTLEEHIDSVDEELSAAVENNKITNEVKVSYDTELETLKTDLDELNKTLESK